MEEGSDQRTRVLAKLTRAGLRVTRQRVVLARALFGAANLGHRHVTVEQLFGETSGADTGMSLATVYNTLRCFREAGLLQEVVVEQGRFYFDTNLEPHHHFFHEQTRTLSDIPPGFIDVVALPPTPPGARIHCVDVVIRLRSTPSPEGDI